jgi:hypothetical protein
MSCGHSLFLNLGANLPAGRQVAWAFLLASFLLSTIFLHLSGFKNLTGVKDTVANAKHSPNSY